MESITQVMDLAGWLKNNQKAGSGIFKFEPLYRV